VDFVEFYYVIWLGGFVALLIASGSVLGERLRSRTLRIIFLPGFLFTAGVKTLFYEIGRVDKRQVAVLDEKQETEDHLERLGIVKRYFVTLGPFILEFVAVVVLFLVLGLRVSISGVWDVRFPKCFAAMQRLGYALTDVLVGSLYIFYDSCGEMFKGKFLNILCLYICLSFIIAMLPQKKSGSRILLGFFGIGLILTVLSLVVVRLGWMSSLPWVKLEGAIAAATGLSFWFFVLVVCVVYLPRKFFRRKKEGGA
jgi:hypothetical protein